MHSISIIIPAYNEHAIIETTLQQLLEQFGTEAHEIILVDQSDYPMTQQIAARYPEVIYLQATGSDRAANMNQGAARATGELLLFLHADCSLPDDARERLSLLDLDETPYGGFVRKMVPASIGTKLTDRIGKQLLYQIGYFLGDNAVFVKRSLFEKVGGFRDKPLFEDVVLARMLRDEIRQRSQRRIVIDSPVIASSRKFMRHGVWMTMGFMLICQLAFFAGYPVERIEQRYDRW